MCFACGRLGHPVNKCRDKVKLEAFKKKNQAGNNYSMSHINIMSDLININLSNAHFGMF